MGAAAGAQQPAPPQQPHAPQQAGPGSPAGALAPGAAPQSAPGAGQAAGAAAAGAKAAPPVSARDRRRAQRLYLEGTRLFGQERFEPAMDLYRQAAQLDPAAQNYRLAVEIARSHAVMALIQQAAKARNQGNSAEVRAALAHARELDPTSPQVAQHLDELADDSVRTRPRPLYDQGAGNVAGSLVLQPAPGVRSFHLRGDRRQVIDQVYRAYGLAATVDQGVTSRQIRFDTDDATFAQASELVALLTRTFTVPLDSHRVLAVADTAQNRDQFQHQELETIYLPGLNDKQMEEVSNLAKNVFEIRQVSLEKGAGAVTVRAPATTLDSFNTTLRDLVDGQGELFLDVKIIQLAHTYSRNIGAQLPQQVTAFNVYSEEQSILNANQALVQQIISSGLASPGDTLAILGILIASGQVSNSIFNNGIALFGGGITTSGVSPQPVNININLNSSKTRELDALQLRLLDGEDQTITSGERYPIQLASYSSGLAAGVNIPGLTAAGSSSSLSSLASSFAAQATIPQVQYQDIGLTLKARPKIMRTGDVALTLDLKLTALSGSSANGNPILDSRSYEGVVTLKEGTGAMIVSELDQQESSTLSGTSGLSEIPGFADATGKSIENDYSTLLIELTPRLVRSPGAARSSSMMRIERGGSGSAIGQ